MKGMDVEQVELMHNPIVLYTMLITFCIRRKATPDTKFIVWPLWHKDKATDALGLECHSLLLQSCLHDA